MTPDQNKKVTFDLKLSNIIYKANIRSLLSLCQENLDATPQKLNQIYDEIALSSYPESFDHDKFNDLLNIDWLMLNSMYIACYSHFEHHLFALASVIEDRITCGISINDIAGKGIHKYRKYMHLIGNLTTANINNSWNQLALYQNVRNLLVHNGGYIINNKSESAALNKNKIFIFLNNYQVTMAGSFGHIRFRNVSFIQSFAELTSSLSDNLTKEIDQLYPEHAIVDNYTNN